MIGVIPQEILKKLKQVPPEKILSYLRIPYKQVGNQVIAQAVWRGEKEASVSIQYKDGKWLWHDFGTGEGGDWIDLYRRITGADFKEAVYTLTGFLNFPYSPNPWTREKKTTKIRRREKAISSLSPAFVEVARTPLRKFLELLELPKDLAEYFRIKGFLPYWEKIREIPELYYLCYRRGGKEYSGLATKTTAGTWIIKNKHGTYVSKQPSGVSFWRRDPTKIFVVEGFTDAMALTVFRKETSILILNGLGNLGRAIEVLKIFSPQELYIALDNDKPGLEGKKKLLSEFENARVWCYEGKDPAEYLVKYLAQD